MGDSNREEILPIRKGDKIFPVAWFGLSPQEADSKNALF